jgi:hypothetical protein
MEANKGWKAEAETSSLRDSMVLDTDEIIESRAAKPAPSNFGTKSSCTVLVPRSLLPGATCIMTHNNCAAACCTIATQLTG